MNPTTRALVAAFAGLGATAAAVPAVLPWVEREFDASVAAAVSALFTGLLAGVLASGPALRLLRALHLAAIGCVVQAVGLLGASFAGTPNWFIASAAVAGLGFGLTEAAASVSTKSATSGSTAAALTSLTATVAVTAALVPLTIAAVALVAQPAPVLVALAIGQAVAAAALHLAARGTAAPTVVDRRTRLRRESLFAVLPLVLALPLYVGVETVFSGWSAVIPADLVGLDPAVAALGTSAFWALMAIGRFVSAALQRRGLSPLRALLAGTGAAAAALGVAAITVASQPGVGLVAIAVGIVALAPAYALVMGLALDRLDERETAAATGALVACGAVGGSLVPALILAAAHEPAAPATFVITAAICLAIAALASMRVRSDHPQHTGSPAS